MTNPIPSSGADELPIAGRIVVEWPKPEGAPTQPHLMTIFDADTGEQWLDVTRMVIDANCDAKTVRAHLTRLVDDDGEPIGGRRSPVFARDGSIQTATFVCVITETRVVAS